MSRHPSLATGRPTRRWGLLAASALAAAGMSMGMGSAAPHGAAAGDPTAGPTADLAATGLAGRFADVALIERGPGQWPDLLTIDAPEEPSSVAWLTLFRRDKGWSKLAEAPIAHGIAADNANAPWLVDLGGTRLALITSSGGGPLSTVIPLDVGGGRGLDALRAGERITLVMSVISAGAADVSGSGTLDLVLAGSPDEDPYAECAGSRIVTLGRDDFSQRGDFNLPHLRLSGAAIGEWDGRPGADLLGHWFDMCPADPGGDQQHHLLATRLADGSTIADVRGPGGEPDFDWTSIPLVIDVDGDGRDEAVVRGAGGLVVLDPTNDWDPLMLAAGDVVALHVRRAPDAASAPPAALLAWVGPLAGDGPLQLGTTRVERVGGTLRDTAASHLVMPMTGTERDVLWSRLVEASGSELPMPAWSIDLDGDACPEVVTLGLQLPCDTTGQPSDGSGWLSTGLLGVFGQPEEGRILTTVGVDWFPFLGAVPIPFPSAAWPDGAWRHGRGSWFGLADLPVAAASAASVAPVHPPTIETFTDADGMIHLHAPTGARLLVRAIALDATGNPPSGVTPSRDAFLTSDAIEAEFVSLMAVRVPAGSSPGSEAGSVEFDIRAMVADITGAPAERWKVTAATLNASGHVSDPAQEIVVWDIVAPTIAAEAPLLSPPWPFQATLRGSSEAGTEVRAGDGPPVVVGPDGSFDLGFQLAPWPQTIELSSTDASGNVATTEVSVMGGVDVRQLPWPAIGTVVVIVAVFASSLRGRRGVQPIATIEVADGEHLPVIEELSAGRIPPRD